MLAERGEVLIYLGQAAAISVQDEALLDLIQPLAEGALLSWMQGQQIEYQQFVEYLPIGQQQLERGNLADIQKINGRVIYVENRRATECIALRNTPVILAGLEVREQVGAYAGQEPSAFPDTTILQNGLDYYLDCSTPGVSTSGLLYRNGTWPTEPRCIQVTYFGGFTDAQMNLGPHAALRYAAILTIAGSFWEAKSWQQKRGVVTSESTGKHSMSLDSSVATMVLGMSHSVPRKAMEMLWMFRSYGALFTG